MSGKIHILESFLYRALSPSVPLMFPGEAPLVRILQDPEAPLSDGVDSGFSGHSMYSSDASLKNILDQGMRNGATRVDVSYDFFFGGSQRENYPDSPLTVKAYKVIYDMAKALGMEMSASILSPLDVGGGYERTHEKAGRFVQFQECAIDEDGTYSTVMDLQTQWTNNKGPAKLRLTGVKALAFDEEQIAGTDMFYVDEEGIEDISETAAYTIREETLRVNPGGYGHGEIAVSGKTGCGRKRCLVMLSYRTPELDYFAEDAGDYMRSIVDLHARAGIQYAGAYSDEMHIQFDWDRAEHFGRTEVQGRYVTENMAVEFARRYGGRYLDLDKYMVYFCHWHGRDEVRHVLGKTQRDIGRTWMLRKRYYDLLHHQVVGLCVMTRDYMEKRFGKPMITTGHTTWEEAPTFDQYYDEELVKDPFEPEISLYEYTREYVWSAAERENLSACHDHFLWGNYLCVVGTDIPEGGFLDRNYYGTAFTAGLAAINRVPFGYYCIWGSPEPVRRMQAEVGQAYGHYALYYRGYELGHHYVQGMTPRVSDVLCIYPMDLNSVDPRFGAWMVQYGYADYISEEKLLEYALPPQGNVLRVKDRSYWALVALFSPLADRRTLELMEAFAREGGKVIWCSAPPVEEEAAAFWRDIFGVARMACGVDGKTASGKYVQFQDMGEIRAMEIHTDLLPDRIYPVEPMDSRVIALVNGQAVGTKKAYPRGGAAVYLGFRPRDDQSGSTGEDVDTLFCLLKELGCYGENSCEALSRPARSKYLYTCFPNGAVSVCPHLRSFREKGWNRTFYRNEEEDEAFMRGIEQPSWKVDLQDAPVLGHLVTYQGDGIVSYRYDEERGLTGFAGKATRGIGIDGREYWLTEKAADLVFAEVSGPLVDAGIQRAYVVKCSRAIQLTLPFDARGMECWICKNHVLDVEKPCQYENTDRGTVLDITPETTGKWIAFLKKT